MTRGSRIGGIALFDCLFVSKKNTNPSLMKILMVCLGNICRSPLAEGILKEKVKSQGLAWEVSSAGTGAYHVGELPDPRSVAEALKNGIDITDQRARQFTSSDFDEYDLILTMDESNYRNVLELARNEASRQKVKMIMSFVENAQRNSVPDPYWNNDGFTQVYDMLDKATEGILASYN